MLVPRFVIRDIVKIYGHAFGASHAENVSMPGYVECFVKCLAMLFKCYAFKVVLKERKKHF